MGRSGTTPSGASKVSRADSAPPSVGVTEGQRTSFTRLAIGSVGRVIPLPIIQSRASVTRDASLFPQKLCYFGAFVTVPKRLASLSPGKKHSTKNVTID